MAPDAHSLLRGLRSYRDALVSHLSLLQERSDTLWREWHALEPVYSGDAANEFKSSWRRTYDSFQDYIERSNHLILQLNERIEALESVEQPHQDLGGE